MSKITTLVDNLIELDQESPARILVIGDYMTDVYVRGKLSEPGQEGCAKFVEQSRVTVPGGAGNAARSLSNWSTGVRIVASFNGEMHPTKTRFMVGDKCSFRHDNDQILVVHSEIRERSLDTISRWRPSAVLLSDYDKGTLTPDLIREVAWTCNLGGIPCVADCKRAPGVYRWCVLKGNADYQHKYSRDLSSLALEAENGQQFVATAGGLNPIAWVNGVPWGLRHDPPLVRCVNHVGAGDCFAAHLTLALAHRLEIADAVMVAHSAGRCYVQHHNNRPPSLEEIREDVASWTEG